MGPKIESNLAIIPDGMERFAFAPTHGPDLSFTGVQIFEDCCRNMVVKLCQTQGGNLVLFNEWLSDLGDTHSMALYFEGDDLIGVMDALNWNGMARTMATKLGWVLTVEVE